MPSGKSFKSAHCFMLRRDFADELGFGEFFASTPRARTVNRRRSLLNRSLGLSPALPRYLGYFTYSNEGYVTPDGDMAFGAPLAGLFQDLLDRLSAGIRANPQLCAVQEHGPKGLGIEADWDGTPRHLVVHDAYTGRAWLVPACEDAFEILRSQK
ncbi:MAG: hypothetical protein ACREFX_03080 [Opitutaceae bacterium]